MTRKQAAQKVQRLENLIGRLESNTASLVEAARGELKPLQEWLAHDEAGAGGARGHNGAAAANGARASPARRRQAAGAT